MTFKDQLTGDLPTFLNTSEFAVSSTVTPLDGSPFTVSGFFDDAFEAVSVETGAVELTSPQLLVRSVDVSGLIRQNDWLEIGAVAYRIIGIEPDGTGMTRLRLSKDAR